jgi:transglutaminase-like putative cysteine protease
MRAAIVLLALVAGANATAAEPEWRESNGFRYGIAAAPAWVEPVPVGPDAPKESSQPAMRVLLSDMQIDHRSTPATYYFDVVYQPLSQEAVRHIAQFEMSFVPDYQQLLLHRIDVVRDGQRTDRLASARISLSQRESRFEQSQLDERVSLLATLEDVRVGDEVRYALSLVGDNPMLRGVDQDHALFGGSFPQRFSRLRALYPAGTVLASRGVAGAPAATIRDDAGGVVFEAIAWHQPAILPESSIAAWFAAYPLVEVAPRRSWADVVRWAQALFPPSAPAAAEIEALLLQWRALPDDEARTLAALHWVQDEVRYFARLFGEGTHRPATPDDVVQRRYGDCKDKSRLLSELLTALGIEARPVLVSMATQRGVLDRLPSGGAFDHVIVRARVDGRDYWLDPTVTMQRGRLAQHGFAEFGAGLEIAAGEHALKAIPMQDEINHIRVEETVRAAARGETAEFDIEAVWRGRAAETMRRDIASRGNETIANEWLERYRRVYGALQTRTAATFEDDAQENAVHLRLQLAGDAPWRARDHFGNGAALAAMGVGHMLELPQELTRRTPLALQFPLTLEHVSHVSPPAGLRLGLVDDETAVKNGLFEYRRKIAASKAETRIEHRFASLQDHVAAEAHPAFFQDMRTTLDLNYVQLKTGTTQSRSQRERRLQNLVDGLLDDDNGKE